MSSEKVCRGECLFGKCPHEHCIKFSQQNVEASDLRAEMNILTRGVMPGLKPGKSGFGVAVDIGTTTVVVYLYDLASAKCLNIKSRINAQASLGVDVISRIQFCRDQPDGLKKMNTAIVKELNELVTDALKEAGLAPAEVGECVITGNTTMLHLLANLSPVSMGVLPFKPLSTFGKVMPGKTLGLVLEEAECYLTPCMSAFVGGDITSALLATGFAQSGEICLLMDIGTNGEVAIGNRDFILSTSTATGPAFEGAHISCGMAGVKGAINAVSALQGKLSMSIIGGGKPLGLCGSGLLDAVALMRRAGVIDETGRIADETGSRFVEERDGEFVITITDDIFISQKDIRELQTAKAAIAAGVLSLVREADMEISNISRVYLAGGFGNYMDQQSAQEIGLLSSEFKEIITVGNAAGAGAIMALFDAKCRKEMEQLRAVGKHVELGSNPYFMEKYVDCMYF